MLAQAIESQLAIGGARLVMWAGMSHHVCCFPRWATHPSTLAHFTEYLLNPLDSWIKPSGAMVLIVLPLSCLAMVQRVMLAHWHGYTHGEARFHFAVSSPIIDLNPVCPVHRSCAHRHLERPISNRHKWQVFRLARAEGTSPGRNCAAPSQCVRKFASGSAWDVAPGTCKVGPQLFEHRLEDSGQLRLVRRRGGSISRVLQCIEHEFWTCPRSCSEMTETLGHNWLR